MQGFSALWLPGTDHASIATEAKIVEAMKEDGVTKDDIGRDGFLERAWEWKRLYGGTIVQQLKKLGSSCDWKRERFTMDEGCSKAVQKVFIELYEKGLIYRGERVINWCPKCKTSISDIECEYEEKDGFFWHIKYPVTGEGSSAEGGHESTSIVVATTRPETMLGDTAIAVHPEDSRYKKLIGKTVTLPLMNREIPIIADEYVDKEFGTGAVKITPAHDPNDFEVGSRHDLPLINVMTDEAIINENGGKYEGLDRYKARKVIVSDLEEAGLLVKTEKHKHNVGGCQRCSTVVEPRASLQWFVRMEELAKPAMEVVASGKLNWVSKRFENTYMQWLENIRDWCISRQLWWGHRIPAYYCKHCLSCPTASGGEQKGLYVSETKLEKCPDCGGEVVQDDDSLDTWFSSALWPFSTLGYPDSTPELEYWYPTSVIVPAYDIIFFWVARMVFMGLEFMDDVPFHDVFIHGLIRDEKGRKMSKSLGNGVDPLEVIDKYGADALRLVMVYGVSQESDIRWSENKILAARNFANKLWNAARFVLLSNGATLQTPSTAQGNPVCLAKADLLQLPDKWILSKFNTLTSEVTRNLDAYDLGVAVGKVHDFIWNVYCDWYIELVKNRIREGDEVALNTLLYVMEGFLKLLHPFMPFITEEIWQSMPHSSGEHESIMMAKWPEYSDKLSFPKEEAEFDKEVDKIKEERAAKESRENRDKELIRLNKELEKTKKDIEFISGKLSNQGFITKAPSAQVENEKKKLKNAQERLIEIEKALGELYSQLT
jgi:valyl-tRNA synthetase